MGPVFKAERILFVLGVSLGALIIVMVWLAKDTSLAPDNAARTQGSFANAPTLPEICSGEKISYEQAKSESERDVPIPHHELANSNNLTDLRECASGVYMMKFDSGLRVSVQANYFDDPEGKFKGMDEDYEDVTYGEVSGAPAALTKPVDDKTNPGDGSVIFVKDGLFIEVIGNVSASEKSLVEVAESLRED
jgi:major membrane immunogen (membrane-anchored lipoprotein)